MLNSAAGVTLPPSKKPPPISTISLDARRRCVGSRIERQRDVGQRAERAQRDACRLGSRHQRLDDEVDARAAVLQRHGRLGQVGAVEAGLAMHVLGGDQRAHQRPDRRRQRP